MNDVYIFGGSYSLSRGQIRSIIEIIDKNKNEIKGLTFNFTRIQNHGVKQIIESLNKFKYKAIRIFDKNLYALDLTNNFIDDTGIQSLCNDLFKVDPKPIDQYQLEHLKGNKDKVDMPYASPAKPMVLKVEDDDVPISTSIRVLTLDHNFLKLESLNSLAKVIISSKQLRFLSIANCRITGDELLTFCQRGLTYARNLSYLDISHNMLGF